MFFDSDDTMRPNHCERALSCSDDADMVGWNVCMHMPYGRTSIKRFYCGDAQFHSLFHGSTATQRYMARTSLFRRAGLWNEKIKYWDDIERRLHQVREALLPNCAESPASCRWTRCRQARHAEGVESAPPPKRGCGKLCAHDCAPELQLSDLGRIPFAAKLHIFYAAMARKQKKNCKFAAINIFNLKAPNANHRYSRWHRKR